MKKNYKKELLRMFSNNLEHFFPEIKNHFMCPICLTKIPISKVESISEAHIIPKAAGGKFKTLICRKCNSYFGSKQDKWFGELVRLIDSEKPSIMHSKIRERYFEIDGIRINGQWDINKDGNFEFLIYKHLNSPDVHALVDDKFRSSPPQINLSVPLPLMKNKHLIDVGFLTAAYLMWFAYLGYSWVLQSHLASIREQILNPDKEIIEANYIGTCNEINCKPWMGFLPLNNDVALIFGIGRHVVILPPRDNCGFYSSMGTFTLNVNISEIKVIKRSQKPYYNEPIGLMFENKLLVLPDMPNEKTRNSLLVIHFTKQSNTARILSPVDEDEYRNLSSQPNVIKHSIKL